MKIGPLTETVRYLDLVREKKDAGDNASGGQQHQQNPEKHEKDPETFEVSEQKVGEAIHAFQADTQAQAHGLNAQVQGQGPGLRVVLKDGTGAVVRQFTGEEFLKLREAASGGQVRGKILDLKF